MPTAKRKVAVFFGGRSPEHDISVITGLQVTQALDPELFDLVPVYISPDGDWFLGEELLDRTYYVPSAEDQRRLTRVTLQNGRDGRATLVGAPGGMFKSARTETIDFALPAFHGLYGEDGCMQGAFELAGVPYSGMRVLGAALLMDKLNTKRFLAGSDIPMLETRSIERPSQGLLIAPDLLRQQLGEVAFPIIAKPRFLGSSIGVAKCDDWDELAASLPAIFKLDRFAVIETCVPNLVEYNISVRRKNGETVVSAIERPKHSSELLDFRAKYMSGGTKDGTKTPGQSSQGMLSLTRDINPELPGEMQANIHRWAKACFDAVGGAGAPRIDFLCNNATGEIWLNEVNPIPGSFAYFLWEAAEKPVMFSSLLEDLIEEGEALYRGSRLPSDPTPEDARIFKRK